MNTHEPSAELQRVAALAVRGFLAEEGTLEFLRHGESLCYRVDAASGRYLLRVHAPSRPPPRPEFFTPQAIESECVWLRALAEETPLVVQQPQTSSSGRCVLSVARSGEQDALPCTLLSWIEGEPVEGRRTPEQGAQLGELLAALRAHAQSWRRPPDFERPLHDRASWRAALARSTALVTLDIASPEDQGLLALAIEQADRELTPLMREPERVGLIHADLHGGNYLALHGELRPIDFGLCGFGPWLWDLAECSTHLGPAARRALIDAYARRWPLEQEDLRRIEGYFLATLVEAFGNGASDPDEREYLRAAVPAWAPHFRRYLARESFLFEL